MIDDFRFLMNDQAIKNHQLKIKNGFWLQIQYIIQRTALVFDF